MTSEDLQKRFKPFAYRLVPLCEALPPKKISRIIQDQLLRSGFSAAANYRAACKGQSKKAFKAKISIAFEEIDESLFWLEAINDLNLVPSEKTERLRTEADELTRILAATRIKLEKEEDQ
ncbi:four helix bundle protein [Flavisolibacter nicotianae]|uniref:four helix bundle protein n=1 Tax=Flavisolibacter nicotianae TaxID=2364882 RepID=UPI000EAC7C6B|nr:four helix bundle protein [Flavisolibacter nicotianae]